MVAQKAQNEAKDLNTQVVNTLEKLTKAEVKVNEEEVNVKMSLDKASEAQSKSSEGYEKVQRALNTVRDISLALNNLDQISKMINRNLSIAYLHNIGTFFVINKFIDEEGLAGLGNKISEVERELEQADLDSKLEQLRNARNKQALWIKNSEDELEALRKEVRFSPKLHI